MMITFFYTLDKGKLYLDIIPIDVNLSLMNKKIYFNYLQNICNQRLFQDFSFNHITYIKNERE